MDSAESTLRTVEIPTSPDYRKNVERLKGDHQPCIVCGRTCPNPSAYLHVVFGGGVALYVADEAAYEARQHTASADNGDVGLYPIGSACVRKNPSLAPCLRPVG